MKHLSEFFNYSERQMQRIIYSANGMSFGENIKKIRMQRAADLLQNTELKVSEIADYLGYYDTSSFRHAFRNYYGSSIIQIGPIVRCFFFGIICLLWYDKVDCGRGSDSGAVVSNSDKNGG